MKRVIVWAAVILLAVLFLGYEIAFAEACDCQPLDRLCIVRCRHDNQYQPPLQLHPPLPPYLDPPDPPSNPYPEPEIESEARHISCVVIPWLVEGEWKKREACYQLR